MVHSGTAGSAGPIRAPTSGRDALLRFGSFLLAYLFLAVALLEGQDDANLHTLADTSVCLVTGILAWLLWDLGAREESAPTRRLAVAFVVAAFWQALHALVAVGLIAAAISHGFPSRPVTWPVPAYLLPVGVLAALLLSASTRVQMKAFGAGLSALGIALLLVFREVPPYDEGSWQGVTRPFLLGAPVLWLGAGFESFRGRDASPLALPLALTSVLFALAHTSMLFSQAPHDPMAMQAHVGTVVGLAFFMTHVIEVRGVGLRERDVAARHATHALQDLGARLDTTLDNMDAAFFTVDHDWRFTYLNKQCEFLLKRSRKDLLGKGLWDEFKGAVGGPADLHYHQAMAENRAVMFEEFYPPLAMWLEVRAYPSSEGLAVYFRDATERKRAAAELLESQARLSGIVTSAMDAIITIDSAQRIVLFNRAAETMFRCSAGDMLGQPLDALIPARFSGAHAGHVERFGAAGVTSRSMGALGALSGVRRDGQEFPIEASISQVEVAGQKLFTVILRDITERKRAAAELFESQARLSGIVTSAMDAIITVDSSQRIVLFNRAAERMFRHDAGAMQGRCLDDLIPARFRAAHAGHVERFGAAGATSRSMGALGALSGLRSDGQEFPIEASISQVEVAGQKLFTVILRDITERKRTEQALRQSEERLHQLNLELEERVVERTAQLEAANKELEAFSYSVSHDLRAPLRTVDGFSQALLEDFGASLPDEGQRQVRTIREGAQRMGALIDDLLAFSRLGRQPLDGTASVDMDELVVAALEELAPERAGRAVEIRAAALPRAQGDGALLRQVWVNLLSNALKYSRDRDPAVVEIGALANRVPVEYFVRDNGTGFDMRYAHKLFGVFQRLHRTEDFEGTGVGLAIVQRIVQRHGGRVWAESAPGRGATFRFTLEGVGHE